LNLLRHRVDFWLFSTTRNSQFEGKILVTRNLLILCLDSESSEIRRLNQNLNQNHVSNILLASARTETKEGIETRGGMEQEERRPREKEQIINTTVGTVNQQIKNRESQLR